MTRRTITTLVTAGILALGGLTVGAAPASAAICPPGQACTVGKSTVYVTAGTVMRANNLVGPRTPR